MLTQSVNQQQQPQPAPTILDLRRSSVSSPPSTPSSLPSDASDSKSTSASSVSSEEAPNDWLKGEVVKGLKGVDQVVLPGSTEEDKGYGYKRTVPTMTLYSQKGLEIYEEITNTKVRRRRFLPFLV
jgi:hypothetical protein